MLRTWFPCPKTVAVFRNARTVLKQSAGRSFCLAEAVAIYRCVQPGHWILPLEQVLVMEERLPKYAQSAFRDSRSFYLVATGRYLSGGAARDFVITIR